MRLYDLESYSYNTYIHKYLSFFCSHSHIVARNNNVYDSTVHVVWASGGGGGVSLPYIYIDVYLHQLEVGENLTYLI